MKKILLALVTVCFVCTGAFADKISDALNDADAQIKAAGEQFPKGTWIDPNYDAAWEFGINNTLILKDAKTGDVIYNFTKSERKNFKVDVSDSGVVITFSCPNTDRSYKFTKPINLGTSITLEIDAGFLTEHYKVNMKFKN